jgi:uncharacterized protein GlcG (DUF336 family)
MRRIRAALALGIAAIFAGPSAWAETVLSSKAPVPDKMPNAIPYGAPINLAKAKQLIAAAEAEATKRNWQMAIAVLDTHGFLVAFEKMDDTQLSSVSIAQGKARTAALSRRPSSAFSDAAETGHPNITTLYPDLVAVPGGLPLVENGKLIGAIGCSGGTSGQDVVTCEAATATLK